MSTTNKLRLEYGLLAVFFISGLCTILKVQHASIVAVLIGSLASFLYFYAAFWLFAQSGVSLLHRIIAGFCYSVNLVANFFCFLRWPGASEYAIISFTGLAVMAVISISNYKKPGYPAQLYRCIFFVVSLAALYCYRYYLAPNAGLAK